MQTNFNAAAAIWSGQLDLVVSAGVEMMSRVPMGSNGGDLSDKLLDRWQIVPQGISAEVIADEWGFSREELDAFSLESHRRAIARDRRGPLRRRDRADRPDQPARRRRLRRRRDAAAGHLGRGARGAEARRSFRREGDRRKLVPDLRRRSGGADRERARGRSARARAAGALRLASGSPASTRTGCCTATRRRASGRSSARAWRGTTCP